MPEPLASDREERDPRSKQVGDRLEVSGIGRDDAEAEPMGGGDHMDVHHVGLPDAASQGTDVMRLVAAEGDDLAAAQEPAELRLASGPADLGDDRGGGHGHEAQLEPHAVVRPRVPVGSLCSDQRPGVVDDAHAERLVVRAVVA